MVSEQFPLNTAYGSIHTIVVHGLASHFQYYRLYNVNLV